MTYTQAISRAYHCGCAYLRDRTLVPCADHTGKYAQPILCTACGKGFTGMKELRLHSRRNFTAMKKILQANANAIRANKYDNYTPTCTNCGREIPGPDKLRRSIAARAGQLKRRARQK